VSGDAERVVDEVADVGVPEFQELLLSGRAVDAADGGAELVGVLIERGNGAPYLGCLQVAGIGRGGLRDECGRGYVLDEQAGQRA
jgi:hypothetical protein